jgi:hypothetical protein
MAREEEDSLQQMPRRDEARPWLISRVGFTPEAEALARREG